MVFLRTVVFLMNETFVFPSQYYLKTPTTQRNVLPEDGEKGKPASNPQSMCPYFLNFEMNSSTSGIPPWRMR